MKVYKFKHDTDVSIVNDWLKDRNEILASIEEFPKHGFLVIDTTGKPIAAGFIRLVEGGVGIVDSIITNPEATAKERHKSLILLGKRIIKAAKALKLSKLIGFTSEASIINRSEFYGFFIAAQRLLIKNL